MEDGRFLMEMFSVAFLGVLFCQVLDKDELEELKFKHRTMLTRGLADVVHVSS